MTPEYLRQLKETVRTFPRIGRQLQLLADVTGLPVSDCSIFPELSGCPSILLSREEASFATRVIFGSKKAFPRYSLGVGIVFKRQPSLCSGILPRVSWQVSYNQIPLFQESYQDCGRSFNPQSPKASEEIKAYLSKTLAKILGGPDPEVAFMDYEKYRLSDLRGQADFFANAYLVLMVHMKELGRPMPPILSKRKDLVVLMEKGEVQKISGLLKLIIGLEGGGEKRHLAHLRAEAGEIVGRARLQADRRNSQIPLEKIFPGIAVTEVKRGRVGTGPHTVLAVENQLDHFGRFSDLVVHFLGKEGRFKRTRVVSEFNLPRCVDLCRTGRIDLVLLDWRHPSAEETLLVRGKSNPVYQMIHGDCSGVLEVRSGEVFLTTPDGVTRPFSKHVQNDLVNTRLAWIKQIDHACQNVGQKTPPCFIIFSDEQIQEVVGSSFR